MGRGRGNNRQNRWGPIPQRQVPATRDGERLIPTSYIRAGAITSVRLRLDNDNQAAYVYQVFGLANTQLGPMTSGFTLKISDETLEKRYNASEGLGLMLQVITNNSPDGDYRVRVGNHYFSLNSFRMSLICNLDITMDTARTGTSFPIGVSRDGLMLSTGENISMANRTMYDTTPEEDFMYRPPYDSDGNSVE